MHLARLSALSAVFTLFGTASAISETMTFAGACDTGQELTVAAAGDLLFHRRLQRLSYGSKAGSKSLFSPQMQRLIASADIAYANFEGPSAQGVAGFGRRVRDPGRRVDLNVYNGYPMFNYHPSVIDGLVDIGFDIVSTSNNHSLDRGALGAVRTIQNMNKRGLPFSGTRAGKIHNGPPAYGDWSRVVKRNNFTTAWLACAEMTNGLPDYKRQVLMCHRDRKIVMSELARLRARKDVDAVFLTPHWGEENRHKPQRRHRQYARAAIEAGATAVIGTHPHVIQPWEKITTEDGREGLAIYSTGNFISGQVRYMQRAGILALVRLVRTTDGDTRIASAGYIPSWVSFARGKRVVTPNTGREGSRSAMKVTRRLLPSGNVVEPSVPFNMPNECRKLTASDQRLAGLSNARHPGLKGTSAESRNGTPDDLGTATLTKSTKRKRRVASAKKSGSIQISHRSPFSSER